MYNYHDDIIRIEVNPASKYVVVQWHDMEIFNISDYELSFTTLMTMIGQHNIRRILIDMSQSVKNMPEKYYHSAIDLLMSGFAFHKVEKIARISTTDPDRENRSLSYTNKFISGMQLDVCFQIFESREPAISWLEA